MLKGIKFKQQKPDIKQDIEFLLETSDKKYVPQSKRAQIFLLQNYKISQKSGKKKSRKKIKKKSKLKK